MTSTAPHAGTPAAGPAAPSAPVPTGTDPATAHLTPELWARATRRLIRKALAEFAHERLLTPYDDGPAPGTPGTPARSGVPATPGATAAPGNAPGATATDPWGAEPGTATDTPHAYTVLSDDRTVAYRFTARRLALDHWHIDAASITRHRLPNADPEDPANPSADRLPDLPPVPSADLPVPSADPPVPSANAPVPPAGTPLPLDALAFFTELRGTLGIGPRVLPLYLEEITATLSSLAFRMSGPRAGLRAAALAGRGFQAVESGMTEGHPCFVANSGRIGFGAHDLVGRTPEGAVPVRLTWLAAHRDHAVLSTGEGLDAESLLAAELDPATRERFAARLRAEGLDPADHVLIPVHPWQWEHRIAVTFAAEVAERRLVHLGAGDDDYLPQQSLRTFFNTTRPDRHYVKTALSVLNMGFLRGLSAAYMEATPAINDWLAALIAADPTLRAARFSILRERAAVGYRPRAWERATDKGSPYRKMLAALWRESPAAAGLEPGRTPVTMACLLHVDEDGGSLAAALIARSGLAPERWLRGYLDAYLVPVLHSLFAYDLAYMPHGENVILVLGRDGGTVERVFFKDIAEEIVVMDPSAILPPGVARIRADVPADQRVLSVFTDVFDCFLRFLSAILHTGGVLAQDRFWHTVAQCVAGYQEAHPHLAERFAAYDLFAPRFARSCLNRLQLRDNQQMLDLTDPSAALQFAGTLANPLAPHADPTAAAEADRTAAADAGRPTGPGADRTTTAEGDRTTTAAADLTAAASPPAESGRR